MKKLLKVTDYEDICQRCGICCGSEDGDPCIHLRNNGKGKYYCQIYSYRFGLQKTIKNTIFKCVPIEEALRSYPELRKRCAYVKALEGVEIKK